jgi:hypothetical protein
MSETHTGQQLGGKRSTAGGGADSEARASHLAGDHENRDHEQEEAPRSFLLILLRALAMHS